MPVTASILYNIIKCPTRVSLDAFGDPAQRDPPNPFLNLLWEHGTAYEKDTIAKLQQPYLDLSGFEGDEKERHTMAALRRGEPLIYSGRISADDLIGVPDLLRKETAGYVPGDIKAAEGKEGDRAGDGEAKPKLHYSVQLALYVDILERLNLSAGRRAFIWDIRGNEVPYDLSATKSSRAASTLWDEYQAALTTARAILEKDELPKSAYSAECKQCHWHTFCIAHLTATDDLTLIPHLGRTLRDVLQPTVPTIAALATADPRDFIDRKKTIFEGVSAERLRLLHKRSIMIKSATPKPYLRAPVKLPASSVELFFDVEVDPLRGICYLHGVLERREGDNASERFISFFAAEASEKAERAAFADAYRYLSNETNGVIYFYSKYERTIYRKLQEKYPDDCTSEDIDRLFDPERAIDLHGDVVIKATEWPTVDHSIKTLAKYLGFTWRDTHPSGAAAVEWYDRWCRERHPAVKQRILDYNEDDCRAMRVLLDGIRELRQSPN
jgi:uncharacterized protein